MTTCTITRAVAAIYQERSAVVKKIVVTLTFDTDLIATQKTAIEECCMCSGSFMPVLPSPNLSLSDSPIPEMRYPSIAYGVVTFPHPNVALFEFEGPDHAHAAYTDYFLRKVQQMMFKAGYKIVIPGLP